MHCHSFQCATWSKSLSGASVPDPKMGITALANFRGHVVRLDALKRHSDTIIMGLGKNHRQVNKVKAAYVPFLCIASCTMPAVGAGTAQMI